MRSKFENFQGLTVLTHTDQELARKIHKTGIKALPCS